MKQTVESGKTLLVDGPASVTVVSGKAEVFGYQVKDNQRTVVREGKRLPFFILEKTEFNISLGPNASVEEFDGCTIPTSWAESVQTVLSANKKPLVLMIVGKADSGKSSFCTYLTNKLVNAKCKVAILDGDLGQSDIGPPCTIAYALTSKAVTELYELKVGNAFFVGVTSPVQATGKSVEGLLTLKNEIMGKATIDYLIINTDGWIEGEYATSYKLQLINELNPDLVIGIQIKDELNLLLSRIEKTSALAIGASASVSERSPEKRQKIRELNYAKYLKDARTRLLFMNYVEIKERNAIPKEPGKEKGLLVGLINSRKRFLGIGVLREVNRGKRAMRVFTSVKTKPAIVIIGKARLDHNLREVEVKD